jgi:Tfp pilus assembly major pilin PilA
MSATQINAILSQNNAPWIAADNHISQLDPASRARLLGASMPPGYQPPMATQNIVATAPGAPTMPMLPPRIDWRNYNGNFVTSVKNQGGCGTCVGFGSMAVAESMYAIEYDGRLVDFSEADAFFCSSHGASCSGWWPFPLYSADQQRGLVNDELFPYATAFPNQNIWAQPPVCNIIPNRQPSIFSYNNIQTRTSVADTREYLLANGPITACFDVYADFSHYSSGVYVQTSTVYEGGHCVAIIGYCDDASFPGGGYYICKNSWGTGWGMGGFFNIAYGQCNIDTYEKVGVCGMSIPIFNPAVIAILKAALTCAGNMPKQAVLVNGWRTLAELNIMSADDIRNTLIVELSKHSTDQVPALQGETSSNLAAHALIYYFLLAEGYTVPSLAAMSLDNQRNTIIVILNKLLGIKIPTLQSYQNGQLVSVLMSSTGGSKITKAVLLNGWRTQAELVSMSGADIRNTLIVELSICSTDTVPALQAQNNQQLAAHGLIYFFLLKQGYTQPALKGMSLDNQRNTLIVILNKLLGISIQSLQALDNSRLLGLLIN